MKDGNNALSLSSATDYYPYGMPMPGRSLTGSENYRYAFQGQERDPETGKEAFELRLWDGRIGRWLSPDPYGQYFSPYLGMGNNPVNGVDSDGGCFTTDSKGNTIPCPDGEIFGQIIKDIDGNEWIWATDTWAYKLDEVTIHFNRSKETNYARDYFVLPNDALLEDFYDALNESNERIRNTEAFVEWGKVLTTYLGTVTLLEVGPAENSVKAFSATTKVGYKSFDDILKYTTKVVKESTKAGMKYFAKGGSKRANDILNHLLNNNFKVTSQSQKNMTLVHRKTGEKIIFRQSKSGKYSAFDTFTKNVNGKNIDIFFMK